MKSDEMTGWMQSCQHGRGQLRFAAHSSDLHKAQNERCRMAHVGNAMRGDPGSGW